MVFSSLVFLFLFLPVVLLGLFVLKKKAQIPFLFLCSLAFYFWGENVGILLIIASTVVNYFSGLLIAGGLWGQKIKKIIPGEQKKIEQVLGLILSVTINVGLLVYFKYFNFFIENVNDFFLAISINIPALSQITPIALPLGISFYTFQAMSYTIDVYRGEVTATRNYITFAAYVTMFPQLVAGPIVRYKDIEYQLLNHTLRSDRFVYGIKRFIIGLSKKVILANTVAVIVDSIFNVSIPELSISAAWLGIIAYAMQIYFDFSGYSDMAIGIGNMLGFDFMENFNYPYISQSIREFWRRWHISLSTWFRDYLYIPLGGNRKSKTRNYFNLIIVFFLCGLWHGASWTFIVWGLYHGLFLIIEKIWLKEILKKIWSPIRYTYTLLVVLIGWVIFRSETISYAFSYVRVMFGGNLFAITRSADEFLNGFSLLIIITGVVMSTPVLNKFTKKVHVFNEELVMKNMGVIIIEYSLLFVAFLFCIVNLVVGGYNPFIYFRF